MKANTRYGALGLRQYHAYLLVLRSPFQLQARALGHAVRPEPTPGQRKAGRIITLTPSMTEVVNALGATDQLVGRG